MNDEQIFEQVIFERAMSILGEVAKQAGGYWRILEPSELVSEGDEYYSDAQARWVESNNWQFSNRKQTTNYTYRRWEQDKQ